MRTSVAILGAITFLIVGFAALSESAQQAYDPAVTNGTNASSTAYNVSLDVVGGLGQAAAPAQVWMGVAAFILVSLGLLYMAVPGRARR